MGKPYIEVKAPYSSSNNSIIQILNFNTKSLEKIFAKYLTTKDNKNALERDNEMLLFGRTLPIKVVNSSSDSFILSDDTITVKTVIKFNKTLKELTREKLYKLQAVKVITPLVILWQDKMSLYCTKLSYRKTKSQWGSCSSKNRISLNSYLCLLPIEIIEYIIVHELAHITHKNHSKEFWSLVKKYQPNYKEKREELKKYSIFLK